MPPKRHWEPERKLLILFLYETPDRIYFFLPVSSSGENQLILLLLCIDWIIPTILMHPEDLGLEEPGPAIVICTEMEKAGNSILLGYMNEVCFGFNPENKALQLSAGDSIYGLNHRILCVHNLVSEIVQIFQAGIVKCY